MKRFSTGYIKGIMGFAILVASQAPVAASTITSSTYLENVGPPYLGNLRHTSGFEATGSGFVDVSPAPDPYIHVQATESNSYYNSALGEANYFFEWLGPTGSVLNDIAFTLDFTDNAPGALVNTGIQLVYNGGVIDQYCLQNQPGGDCNTSSASHYQGVLQDTLQTNTIYEVQIFAHIFNLLQTTLGRTDSASIDPIVSIDPSFTGDPSAYSLVLSDGIGNSSADAPEPGTEVLAVTGVALTMIAAFRRRRRGGESAEMRG